MTTEVSSADHKLGPLTAMQAHQEEFEALKMKTPRMRQLNEYEKSLTRQRTLLPSGRGKLLRSMPEEPGYCLVFDRQNGYYELAVDETGVIKAHKSPDLMEADWKSLLKTHHLKDHLDDIFCSKDFKKYNIQFYVKCSQQEMYKNFIYVIIACDYAVCEEWADIHGLDVPINPQQAIKKGRYIPGFDLARNTYLKGDPSPYYDHNWSAEQSAIQPEEKKESAEKQSNTNRPRLLTEEHWKHIHMQFNPVARDTGFYQTVLNNHDEQTIISHAVYLRILHNLLTEENALKGAGYVVSKYLADKQHPLRYFFAINRNKLKPKFSDESYLLDCGKDCRKYESPDCCKRFWINRSSSREFVDAIRNYYGENFSFWFAFLVHYTRWLYAMVIPGVCWQLAQFYYSEIAIPGCSLMILIVIIWSAIMIEQWYRREWHLRFKWGMLRYSQTQVPRPEFQGRRVLSEENGSLIEAHPSFASMPIQYWCRILCSLSSMLLFLAMVMVVVAAMWLLGAQHRSDQTLSVGIGVLNSVQIFIFNKLYTWLALKLNECEHHRLQQDFYNNLIVKRIIFITFNSFYSVFYIAFIDDNPVYDDNTKRLEAVRLQLFTLFISALVLQNTIEVLLPYLNARVFKPIWAKFKIWQEKRYENAGNYSPVHTTEEHNGAVESDPEIPDDHEDNEGKEEEKQPELRRRRQPIRAQNIRAKKREQAILADIEKQINLGPTPSVLDNTAEIVILHGYITLFVFVLPCMPLLAIINNYLEIRIDFYNLINSQRSVPESATGLGVWKRVIYAFSVIGVFSNVALLTFRTHLIQSFLTELYGDAYQVTKSALWIFYLLACGVLLGILYLIWMLIPKQPMSVKQAIARQEECHLHLLAKPVSQMAQVYQARSTPHVSAGHTAYDIVFSPPAPYIAPAAFSGGPLKSNLSPPLLNEHPEPKNTQEANVKHTNSAGPSPDNEEKFETVQKQSSESALTIATTNLYEDRHEEFEI